MGPLNSGINSRTLLLIWKYLVALSLMYQVDQLLNNIVELNFVNYDIVSKYSL